MARKSGAIAEKPTAPPGWTGSLPEWCVYNALMSLGWNGRFIYQYALLGGRLIKGGTVADFYIPELGLAIYVQSRRFHYEFLENRIADNLIRAILISQGIRVVYIDEEDALANASYYVAEALVGIDMSRMALGV